MQVIRRSVRNCGKRVSFGMMMDVSEKRESYYAGYGVYGSGERVDGYYVGAFVVPWAVLSPVCCRDFFPRVLELVS